MLHPYTGESPLAKEPRAAMSLRAREAPILIAPPIHDQSLWIHGAGDLRAKQLDRRAHGTLFDQWGVAEARL